MSARKLGRFAGLVFVLVLAVGGFAAAGGAQHDADSVSAIDVAALSWSWE